MAAQRSGIPVCGVDLNPVAGLFSHVKVKGFSATEAKRLANALILAARRTRRPLPVQWPMKRYWFTPTTLEKFERLRAASIDLRLTNSEEGMAVLLSLSLAVRLCSKADQRSPKPFISRSARESRNGRHFDPYLEVQRVLDQLGKLYGSPRVHNGSRFCLADVAVDASIASRIGRHSHIITSPPYINAQDYFRNFKLELYVLEGILPFGTEQLRDRFIGTERGDLLAGVPGDVIERNYDVLPQLKTLARKLPRLGAVVHRYLHDMGRAFDNLKACLEPKGRLVVVCGDNLIGGIRVPTWKLLRGMLEDRGFKLFDLFADRIEDRMLPPKRCGHKGLIKQEVVCAFRLI